MSLGTYIKETQAELKHVSWPSKKQAMAYTILVIGISVFVAFYLGVFDYLFSQGLQTFLF